VLLVGLTVGCAGKSRQAIQQSLPDDAREGRTAVRLLSQAEPKRPVDQAEVTMVPARAGPENRLPVYPEAALRAGCDRGRIPLRIHIGTNGRVISQAPVPGTTVPDDSCHAEFAAAVRSTVADWGFFPAMRKRCSPQTGAMPDCSDAPLTIYLDLEFSFEVVRGKGVVTSP
jgi:outer membrane biosynthesis protein TonB